jgi:transketolase
MTPFHQLTAALRSLCIDMIERAQSGHPGMPMGMADVATVLFRDFMVYDSANPHWPNRDRFVLSAGHGSALQYALSYLTNAKAPTLATEQTIDNYLKNQDNTQDKNGLTLSDLAAFRQLHSRTPGHPERGITPGVEVSTGPLGQGLASAVGLALAESNLRATYGSDLINHYTYVMAGDGCLMEGISHEAASLAGHLTLKNLIVFFDDNGISIDGSTDLAVSDDTQKRFEALNWHVLSIDGHDESAIADAIQKAKNTSKPSLIMCKTIIGYGSPAKAGTEKAHGSPLGNTEAAAAKQAYNWPHTTPFFIPQSLKETWAQFGLRSTNTRQQWEKLFTKTASKDLKRRLNYNQDFDTNLHITSPALTDQALQSLQFLRQNFVDKPQALATRALNGQCLQALLPHMPELMGGSADLSGSNCTNPSATIPLTPHDHKGNYIHYGVREHAMGAIMNGLAAHGGFVSYGGTFLVFSDYCRPSIRLSALMDVPAIYVMTHDSVGLGEDGPTHQPVEHLASLRAMPNVQVLRPCDGVELTECWALALAHKGPSILALSRQKLPALRTNILSDTLKSTAPSLTTLAGHSQKGLYCLSAQPKPKNKKTIVLMASGSEVGLAMDIKQKLTSFSVVVYSAPCLDRVDFTDLNQELSDLGPHLRVAIEAAAPCAFWYRLLRSTDLFIGIEDFGLSAPIYDVFNAKNLTVDKIIAKITQSLSL